MALKKKQRVFINILLVLAGICAVTVGIVVGLAFSSLHNLDIRSDLNEYTPSLPTQILDRNGDLITEIFGDEKRDIIPIDEIPKHFIYALISREDATFFEHKGFSFKGTSRAALYMMVGKYAGGGSTLTQQVAGRHYADRNEMSIKRKIKELWFAFQMERDLSKKEILEVYLNEVYFGHTTYGVEVASQFYFGHSVRDITVAESAILVIQLSSPAKNSPINHPDRARQRQIVVLDHMVELGFISREEADASYSDYWNNFDYSRSNTANAYTQNDSKAPYFSEYVRLQLNDLLYGAVDINKDGYIVHTTLDLQAQEAAEEVMTKKYREINLTLEKNSKKRYNVAQGEYVPIVDLLGLAFNMDQIMVTQAKKKKQAKEVFSKEITPLLATTGYMLGVSDLHRTAMREFNRQNSKSKQTVVEGALVSIDNHTGHILSMIGGSDFETKKYNRAVDAKVMPGSCIKPLYYSAAISSRKFTPATKLADMPVVFIAENGEPYEPTNYLGAWQGSVLLRYALATSMNVPSLQVLDGVGFDLAIDSISGLLGMSEYKNDESIFPRVYPLGLGIIRVAPIDMARAFATFPNQGRQVDPIAIISVKDRNGNLILDHEKDQLRERQKYRKERQILTPQEAYMMVDLLHSTVEFGTLRYRRIGWNRVEGFNDVYKKIPMAGKTGTTQNWGDAWTVGFSPYVTTAVWFGFDMPGNSLGRELTGATAAGPTWAEYMTKVHQGKESTNFPEPETGLIRVKICTESGMLPTKYCHRTKEELFLMGTQPQTACRHHKFVKEQEDELVNRMIDTLEKENYSSYTPTLEVLDEAEDTDLFDNSDDFFSGGQDFLDSGDNSFLN